MIPECVLFGAFFPSCNQCATRAAEHAKYSRL